MGRNFFINDILEGLYKPRIRESEKLKNVLDLCNVEIHQKKAKPDFHRLKTMVKRSIEQNLRTKNLKTRNGNFETSAVVKKQMVKQREQRSLGDCWQWKANGQCYCSFRHDKDEHAKSTQPNPSPISEKWHPPERLFTSPKMDAELGKSALMRIARLTDSLAKGLKRMVTKVQWLC